MLKEEFLITLSKLQSSPHPKEDVETLRTFLKDIQTPFGKAAKYYLVHFVIPVIFGAEVQRNKPIPFEVYLELFATKKDVSWEQWLSMFPGSAIEVREDKTHGQTLLYGLPYKPEWAKERRAGVFYSPNGFHEKPSEGHATRRSLDNIKHFNAIWGDFDSGHEEKEATMKLITSLPIIPSIVVETRRGYHVIYRLEGECTLADWQKVQTGFIDFTKSDKACKDASRLLRMPGSWHCKDMWDENGNPSTGEPFLISIIWNMDKKVSLDVLKQVYVKDEPTRKKVFYLPPSGYWDNPRTPKPTVLVPGERHGSLAEEAGRIYKGLDPAKAADARSLLKEWYTRASQPLKQGWEREVDEMADWVERREFGSVTSR